MDGSEYESTGSKRTQLPDYHTGSSYFPLFIQGNYGIGKVWTNKSTMITLDAISLINCTVFFSCHILKNGQFPTEHRKGGPAGPSWTSVNSVKDVLLKVRPYLATDTGSRKHPILRIVYTLF